MKTTNETNELAIENGAVVVEPEVAVSAALVAVSEPEQADTTPPEAKPKRKRASKPKPEPASESKDAEARPKRASKKAASAKSTSSKDVADAKPSPSTKRAKPTKGSTSTLPSKNATLEDVAAAYVAQIENDGASTSTVTGYRAELNRALGILGRNTLMSDLSADSVKRYMRCKMVTMKRDGSPRDQKTIDRTRRVLRLALVFAEERGIVEHAPIPEKI